MSDCYVEGCEQPTRHLVPVEVSDDLRAVGIHIRMRRFCTDHKPPAGTVIPA